MPAEAARVRELIAGQHSKAALQLAKDLYKRWAAAESETLLVEAYTARIDDLLKLGMMVEAKALLAIVRERFPGVAILGYLIINLVIIFLCRLAGASMIASAKLRSSHLTISENKQVARLIAVGVWRGRKHHERRVPHPPGFPVRLGGSTNLMRLSSKKAAHAAMAAAAQ